MGHIFPEYKFEGWSTSHIRWMRAKETSFHSRGLRGRGKDQIYPQLEPQRRKKNRAEEMLRETQTVTVEFKAFHCGQHSMYVGSLTQSNPAAASHLRAPFCICLYVLGLCPEWVWSRLGDTLFHVQGVSGRLNWGQKTVVNSEWQWLHPWAGAQGQIKREK